MSVCVANLNGELVHLHSNVMVPQSASQKPIIYPLTHSFTNAALQGAAVESNLGKSVKNTVFCPTTDEDGV